MIRHAASVTSSRQSLVSDVTAGESPGAAPDDDVIGSDEGESPLEKDIVRRRIDLFENQVRPLFNKTVQPGCYIIQIVTGIEVNSESYFPKLREYCPSAEGTRAIFPQLREISLTIDR